MRENVIHIKEATMADVVWQAWRTPHFPSKLHVEAINALGQKVCAADVCGDEVRWIGEQPRKKPEAWKAAAVRRAARASAALPVLRDKKALYTTGPQKVPSGML